MKLQQLKGRVKSLNAKEVVLESIGIVKASAPDDEIRTRAHELEATIEIFPEFHQDLEGLEGFSHIFVLSYFHKLRPDQIGHLKVRPRRLLQKGMKLEDLPLVGVFATGSPSRPNPIGLSLVKLIRIDQGELIVRGLDCFNGTPVLDIKAYKGNYQTEDYQIAEWYRKIGGR
jgi:tRNA-Thr(GGU) m(6)t(6)A37 methyltransferase TsaA